VTPLAVGYPRAMRRLLGQLSLARRNRSFGLLLAASVGSGAGSWLALVALNVDILARTDSGFWLAALNSAALLPSAFIGLVGGPLVDRLSRKALVVGSDLLRVAVFAALPFVDGAPAIVALALVAGIGDAFFRPAVLAGVPNLVDEDDLDSANFLLQAGQWLTTAAGPLLGGAIVAAASADVAYVVNSVSFGVSALLLARIPARLLQSDRPLSRGHLRDLLDGFSLVRRSYPLLVVFVVWNITMIGTGAVNVSEVVLAEDVLGAGAFGYGLLWAASGVGLVVGGAAFVQFVRSAVGAAYPAAIAVAGLAVGVAAVAPNIWVAAAAMVFSGLGNGVAAIANIRLVQRGAPDSLRGRAFTVVIGTNFAVVGLAMFAGGALTDRYGARWVWAGAALVLLAAAVVARLMSRSLRLEDEEPGAVQVRATSAEAA
jgi:MFS family permease